MASATPRGTRCSSTGPMKRTSARSTAENSGALPLSSLQMRSATLGPTPGARVIIALSRIAIAAAPNSPLVGDRNRGGEFVVLEGAEHRERHLGADALHGLQQAEPFALDVGDEAEQPDLILAHMRLDRQRRGL